MKKVSLVVMDRDRETSLEKLRDLGVLHLTRKSVSSAVLSGLLEKRAKTEAALAIIRSVEVPKKGADARTAGAKTPEAVANPAAKILELGDERKRLQDELVSLARERSRIEKWGDFDPKAFAEFAAKGIVLVPYLLPRKAYDALGKDTQIIVLGEDKSGVYVLSVGKEISGETPFVLGEYSLSQSDAHAEEMRKRIAAIEGELVLLVAFKPAVEAEKISLDEQGEFETARAGMDAVDDTPAEFAVSWLSGFIPAEDLGLLKRGAAENGWALIADDPGPDDEVPTKLKNNRFANLISPLTGFLEVVPGYNEVDISGWFLLFFCIFFGMIFGDAGYGFLLILSGVLAALLTAKKGVPAAVKMLLLLSFSNFVWGVITCTWFGIDADKLPEILRRISVPLISNAKAVESAEAKALVDQNLQIVCFSLALLQLSIAHIKGFLRNIRSLKLLGELGSIAMLAGMYNVVLSLVVSNSYRRIPFMPFSLWLIAGGFGLTFIFAGYEGNILKSIVNSLKNIISVVLGITNVFSDIMSYIRLWAVGLAGASISATVNSMAGPLLGNFLVFLGIIILVFGHGLNIILNVLSVLVHGVRLNTLEFSGHLGLTWSGTAYKPFAKRIKK
jgi:V/A-type H+-transporting ATPase subunit I